MPNDNHLDLFYGWPFAERFPLASFSIFEAVMTDFVVLKDNTEVPKEMPPLYEYWVHHVESTSFFTAVQPCNTDTAKRSSYRMGNAELICGDGVCL